MHTVKTQSRTKPDHDVKPEVVNFAQAQISIYWFFYASSSKTEFTTVKSSIKYNTVIYLIFLFSVIAFIIVVTISKYNIFVSTVTSKLSPHY